jgi:hypothetical protein
MYTVYYMYNIEYSGLDRLLAPLDHQSTSETHPAGLHEIGGEASKWELQ